MTAHLCFDWCEECLIPLLPPVVEPACTPTYIAYEQGSLEEAIELAYTDRLQAPHTCPASPVHCPK